MCTTAKASELRISARPTPPPAMRRLGLTSMLISYRDDDGVAESPDGLHHLGMTEWRDLEAAARYASRRFGVPTVIARLDVR